MLSEELHVTHPIPDTALPENLYAVDSHLQLALKRRYGQDYEGCQRADAYLQEWGGVVSRQLEPLTWDADRNTPELKQFNRRGQRVDELVFHPAYHEIGRLAYSYGLAAMANRAGFRGWERPAPQVLKNCALYLHSQVEGSVACPISMTDVLARVLNKFASPEIRERFVPRLTSTDYGTLYTGAMFMTEKTGGSDVGATTTTARRNGDWWELQGDKWFCSNVGADLILTLARPEGAPEGTRGLGLFLVPRNLPDGTRNSYVINRLKDKLGTRAMASGEVTLQGAKAYLIEPLERGFAMMMEMVNGTRIGSGVAGAGSLRRAFVEAQTHAAERRAFGKTLAEQPLIARTLANLAADSAATTSLMLAASAWDDRAEMPEASRETRVFARLLIALLKRYATSHGVKGAQTAMEIRGGNGYIEDFPNARLLRDAYVQIIWEGGVNMVSFDVLRLLERENGWTIFTNQVQNELANVSAPELHADFADLKMSAENLARQDRETRECAAPALTHAMASFYAALQLAQDAAFAAEHNLATDARTLLENYRRAVLQPSLFTLNQEVQ
jgi:acyl-CoA dehydrogenase